MRVVPSEQRRSRAMSGVTLWPGNWPPSPGLEPWAILICSSSADIRYSAVTPNRAEATCLIRSLAESPPGSVVQNLAQVGLPGALTGPVARGDVSSVERHLEVLTDRAPELLSLYRTMGKHLLRLARRKSPLDADTVAKMESLLTDPEETYPSGRHSVLRSGPCS